MADNKKWVTINSAHVPIEDGKPQYGGDKPQKETRVDQVGKLKNIVDKKLKDNDGFKEQGKRSKFFDDENDDLETVKVDLTADIQKQFDNATPKERAKIAYRYIMDNLRSEYETGDGRSVPIERIGADKMTHTKFEPKIRATPELGRLLQSGRFIGEAKAEKQDGEKHKKFDSFAYYKVKFALGKEKYTAVLNVGIRPDKECTLYDINQFNKI